MPYLSGGNLRQRFKEKLATGPGDIFPWLAQIAAALDYLHAQNVVHRDVKPDNVLFDEQVAYLTDLGAVKVQEGSSLDARTKLTSTGTALGTPPYMAPELILGRPYDGRSDQYALAVIVCEAFTGQHPYDASSLGSLIQSLMGPEPERLDSRCGAPPGVADAVARGLARDPSQRFPSCRDFAVAVEKGFAGKLVRSATLSDAPSEKPGPQSAAGARSPGRVSPRPSPPVLPAAVAPTVAASPDMPPALEPTAPAGGSGQAATLPAGVPEAPFADPASPVPIRSGLRRQSSGRIGLKRLLAKPAIFYTVIALVTLIPGLTIVGLLFRIVGVYPPRESGPPTGSAASYLSSPTPPASATALNAAASAPTAPTPAQTRAWRVAQGVATFEDVVRQARAGDTILLPPGQITLREPIVINKSLIIRGAGRDQTRLLSWEEGFALKFTGDAEWTLADLTLEHVGNKWANVVVVESGSANIRNCVFTGGVWDKQNRRGGDGIWFTGNARGHVADCLCRNNGYDGISVGDQAQPLLEGNTCENNKDCGILYWDSAGGTARQNVCRQNGKHGIGVGGQAQPLLEGNTCENNQRCGILYRDSAGGTARQNVCRQNGHHGIEVSGQAQPLLEGNTCENNESCGIAYFHSADGTARNNTCRNNDSRGIYVGGQAQPLLEGNTCENNWQWLWPGLVWLLLLLLLLWFPGDCGGKHKKKERR